MQNHLAALQALSPSEPTAAPSPEVYPAEEPEADNSVAPLPGVVQVKATAAPGMPGGRTWSIKQVMK